MKSKKIEDQILQLRTKVVQYKQDVEQTYLELCFYRLQIMS